MAPAGTKTILFYRIIESPNAWRSHLTRNQSITFHSHSILDVLLMATNIAGTMIKLASRSTCQSMSRVTFGGHDGKR